MALVACGDNKLPIDDHAIPPEVDAVLDHDDQGRPILIQMQSMISEDEKIALVYDKDLDDPISRWGACLGQVSTCFRAVPGATISECIGHIRPCASDAGGKACCAPACLDDYRTQRGRGLSEKEASIASFLRGDCMPGLAAFRGSL